MHTYIQTHLGVFSMIDHLQITLPIKPFSPVSDVPSSGAGKPPMTHQSKPPFLMVCLCLKFETFTKNPIRKNKKSFKVF